jgi:glucose/arabinose dehydrogenase
MKRWSVSFLFFVGIVVGIISGFAAPASAQIKLVPFIASGLSAPVEMVQDPTTPTVQYVVQQGGLIKVIKNGIVQTTAFLDLTTQVLFNGERGLLSLAFAPDYATSRRLYVYFINTAGNSVLSRFLRSTGNALVADPATRFDITWNDGQKVIIQPDVNHKGAKLTFGPADHYLYIGLGDGGGGGDQYRNAQNISTLLGKMLRLDVNVPDSDTKGYRIPPDNPFLDGHVPGALGEIWAFGYRNPWRYSWDDPAHGGTGALVVGDVGQGAWEEIDYEPAGAGGRNYGWARFEGTHDYDTARAVAFTPLRMPIFDYPHSGTGVPVTGATVIGGYIYRGSALPALYQGRYFFADYISKRLCSFPVTVNATTHEAASVTGGEVTEHTTEVGGTGLVGGVVSIDADSAGELYFVRQDGKIYKLVSATTDADGDGLPDDWETRFGLKTNDATGDNGANGDPDHDGVTNLQEYLNGSNPVGVASLTRYFAEGSNNAFFNTTIDLANPGAVDARVVLRFLETDGTVVSNFVLVPAQRHVTVATGSIQGVQTADFSTVIETDQEIVAERTMVWTPTERYGSHSETAVKAPSTDWFLAEGATHGVFSLFYLIENPSDTAAQVRVNYLLPAPQAPIVLDYTVDPHSRRTIPVDDEPGLGATDVSAAIHSQNSVPIIVERAMYFSTGGQAFRGGHDSAGVTQPNGHWFFAEGATGSFFNMFLLLANPSATNTANVTVSYLLPDGTVIPVHHVIAPNSRQTYNVADEAPALVSAAFSTVVDSDVPILAERSMYWPHDWTEASNSPGATETGALWAVAGGDQGGSFSAQTYVLIANTSNVAGTARVTVLLENGAPLTKDFPLAPNSRTNVDIGGTSEFAAAVGTRFGVLVQSLGTTPAQIVVERSTYSNDSSGTVWAAGATALATKLR